MVTYASCARLAEISLWVVNHTRHFMYDVIIHPCPTLNGSLHELVLKSKHGQMNTFHGFMWMDFFYRFPNFDIGLTKLCLLLWHGWVIASRVYVDVIDCTYTIMYSMLDIKNNAGVTVNNDLWVTSEAICQWFSLVTKSGVKIIGKSPHEWPKNRYSR